MGTYLSTPVTEKHEEFGESWEYYTHHQNSIPNDDSTTTHNTTTTNVTTLPKNDDDDNNNNNNNTTPPKAIPYVHWGVVEMQGWRKSMEDAHVTQTNVTLLPPSILAHSNRMVVSGSGNTESETNETVTTTTAPPVMDITSSIVSPPSDTTTTTSRFSSSSSSSATEDEVYVTHVFGVFDGHGGGEVARFVALYIVSVLQQQLSSLLVSSSSSSSSLALESSSSSSLPTNTQQQYQLYQQHIGTALIQTFHALDRMIDDPTRRDEILKLRTILMIPTGSAASRPEQRVVGAIPPPKPLLLLTSSLSSSSSSSSSFVPPATTLSSPNTTTVTVDTVSSPQVPSVPLTTTPSNTTTNVLMLTNHASSSPTKTTTTTDKEDTTTVVDTSSTNNAKDDTISTPTSDSATTVNTTSTGDADDDDDNGDDDNDSLDHPMDGTEEACALDQDMMLEHNDDETMHQDHFDDVLVTAMMTTTTVPDHHDDADIVILPNNSNNNNTNSDATTRNDDGTTTGSTSSISDMDSTNAIEVVVVDSESPSTISSSSVTGKVSGMLQRLLKLSGPAGQVILGATTSNTTTASNANNKNSSSAITTSNTTATQSSTTTVATTNHPNNTSNNNTTSGMISPPSVVRNGQLMCNLKDHPIHAGATAIVAVIHGRTLTVANAGDSRAVLCRGYQPQHPGTTTANTTTADSNYYQTRVVPLSIDHKPMQATELFRIIHAGGFVNTFGRINGNLNLSRSIGDLKYKQVHHLPPSQQMITAEPDIVQLELNDTDEFIIIGCDGIWDCLSNEKAVEFVATRIHDYTPTEIGTMMLNFIISPDPRQTQGIGGDNMTILIIDLQPKTRRWYRSRSIQSSATMSDTGIPNDTTSAQCLAASPTK